MKSRRWLLRSGPVWALIALAIVGAAVAQSVPTAPVEPHAVLLAPGVLRERADATAPEATRLGEGAILRYYGETTDPFGRPWSIVGDPGALVKRERWFAIAATPREIAALTEADLLTSLPAPRRRPREELVGNATPEATLAAAREPVSVAVSWWQSTERQMVIEAELADLLGADAFRVDPGVVEEAIAMIGGREWLGPWPEEPAFGRLHVSPLLPVVWRFDGDEWRLLQDGLSMTPAFGLLGNGTLAIDPRQPRLLTGSVLPCWSLVGGRDPGGTAVGRLETAPAAPIRVARPERRPELELLGLYDLEPQVRPLVSDRLRAPRLLVPAPTGSGIQVQDNSARQAVYLEQALPPELTAHLRGRTIRFRVDARVPQEGDVASTGTVSVELIAGSESISTSVPVGALPTPITLSLAVPADAQQVRVRLIPLDRSIAVPERGTAIFERATLVPADWPDHLEPAPLLVRRIRIVTYEPARRYVRSAVAVSERAPAELERTWGALLDGEWDDEARRRMLAGELRAGMPQEEVRLAWGEPESRTAIGSAERWDWPLRSAAFDAGGRLLTWTDTAEPPLPEPRRCMPGSEPQ